MTFKLPSDLTSFGRIYRDAGFHAYLVGGAVRNLIMRLEPADWDIATDATPENTMKLFRRVIPTGIQHGTVTVLYKQHKIEVTTFRIEGDYSDARRPDSVTFTPSLFEDLKRRDFTMNAMAIHLVTGELVDPHAGRDDIRQKLVRAVGDPSQRMAEDALRVVRAIRFAAQLGFAIDPDTLTAMGRASATLARISIERIRDEINKMLGAPVPSIGFRIALECGALEVVMPELAACTTIEQAGPVGDLFTHSLLSCDGAPSDDLALRLAALLHDLGKVPTCRREADGSLSFHRHEMESERIATALLVRFRYPNAVIKRVALAVRHHMFHYEPGWSDAAVRRFISRVGSENLSDLFALRRADTFGKTGHPVDDRSLAELERRVDRVKAASEATTVGDLAINGNDLSREAGIPKGPLMGAVLGFLLESVIEDPALNVRDRLLAIARSFYRERLEGKSE